MKTKQIIIALILSSTYFFSCDTPPKAPDNGNSVPDKDITVKDVTVKDMTDPNKVKVPECSDANQGAKSTLELTVTGLGKTWKASENNKDIFISYQPGEKNYRVMDFNGDFTKNDELTFTGTADDAVWGVRQVDLVLKVYRQCGRQEKNVDIKPLDQVIARVPAGSIASKNGTTKYSFRVSDLLTTIETSLCTSLNTNTYFTAQVIAYTNNNCVSTVAPLDKVLGPSLRFKLENTLR